MSRPAPRFMVYFDAHCHYQDPRLRGVDFGELPRLGIRQAVVNGSSEEDWPQVADLASRYPNLVRPAFGLHPWHLKDRSPQWRETLLSFLDAHPTASLGETGLDRWKQPCHLPGQEAVFLEHLSLATTRNLPLSIHCLKAWGRLLDLLQSHPRPARGFLLHSYGGSWEMAQALLPLGARFSFAGYFLLPHKAAVRDVFRRLPLDRVLLETDAPDQCLPPELDEHPLPDPDLPSRRLNHPANLAVIHRHFALLRSLPEPELQDILQNNFHHLFP